MENYIAILLILSLNSPSCVIQGNNAMQSEVGQPELIEVIVNNLTEAGYPGLFMSGSHDLSNSIWQNGENRIYLEQIVQSSDYSDLNRLLASELLYERVPDYPPIEWQDVLAYLYAQALAITGDKTGAFQIAGNQWGFMYYNDELQVKDYGILGTHLVATGTKAIPYLAGLLDNADTFLYIGSQEATLGNSLGYRVKDAAAYYIGQISGIPIAFHEETTDRDAEIERLKKILENHNG